LGLCLEVFAKNHKRSLQIGRFGNQLPASFASFQMHIGGRSLGARKRPLEITRDVITG
jgi:hypothetical protein